MKNIPKEIFLQVEERTEDFKDHSEVTWCSDKQNETDIRYALADNSVINSVSEPFTNKQSHKVRTLLKEFYLWMQANDYDHNIPQRVENKAELFLREKNVR
jgi:hypothetical protein